MKRNLWKFLFVGSMVFLLANGKFPPPSTTPKQPGIANGGRAVAIAVDSNNANNLMVASDSGGLFRSTNHGANWIQVSGGSTFWFTDVTYLSANDNIILATAYADTRVTSGGGIWRSIDGGTSWTRASLNPPTSDCTDNFSAYGLAAETGRSRVWAGTLCGLAYSDDEGTTWNFLPVVSGYSNEPVFAVLAPSTGRLAIRTYSGVKVSTDDGSTWSLSTAGLPSDAWIPEGAHNQLAVSPNNPDDLYWAFNYYGNGPHVALFRSADNGASWNPIFDNPGSNRPPFVRTAHALSGDSLQYEVYFSDGACTLERATAFGDSSIISSWTPLSVDHCDAADIGFSTDHKTPLLLATDGGLHNTSNNGLSWSLVGGGKAGYDALEIYQATGQLHNDGASADLYFGSQDNSIWASPDEGGSWTVSFDSEGYNLDVVRDFLPANQTEVTGEYCVPCQDFISGPLLAGVAGFPDVSNHVAAPRLLQPGDYVQQTEVQGLDDSVFALTTTTGSSWTNRYSFPEPAWDLPLVAGSLNDPVLYTEVKEPGVNSDGSPLVEIKRVSGVLGNLTPLVSNISGFGSLGTTSTTFVGHAAFGVDPNNPNYLIVSDTVDNQIKVSTDAGTTWTPDTALTDLITESGQFKFSWWPSFTQTTAFAFDPECDGHILVGTKQAGVFETFDRGGSWHNLVNSDLIPEVTSIFFPGNGRVIISSFGRGLWQSFYLCPAKAIPPGQLAPFAEPVIYWKGAKVPISQIHDPEVCPACGYYLLIGGRILDYKTAPGSNQLIQVMINRGTIKGYTWQGADLPLPFQVTRGEVQGGLGGDRQLQGLPSGRNQIKGLFLEGDVLRGLILAEGDLSVDQLPKMVPLGAHITLSVSGPQAIDTLQPIQVRGVGFNPAAALEVLLDGQIVQPVAPPDFDPQGGFTLSVAPLVGLGPHSIWVRQETTAGVIQDISTFVVTTHDSDQ